MKPLPRCSNIKLLFKKWVGVLWSKILRKCFVTSMLKTTICVEYCLLTNPSIIFNQQPSITCFSRIISRPSWVTQLEVLVHLLTNMTSWDSSEEVGRDGQGELGLEDKLQLNFFNMRWSSLLLELLRKDVSACACARASMCCSACVCVVTAVKTGQHSKHCGWWGVFHCASSCGI